MICRVSDVRSVCKTERKERERKSVKFSGEDFAVI